MLRALDELVESRIRDAQQRGEFAGLPGEGRPLPEEDLTGVPETLRVAHRILKNAGCVPAEVAALRDLDTLLAQTAHQAGAPSDRDAEQRRRGARRLLALTVALEARGLGRSAAALIAYRDRLVERLGR
jgi:hypothetical protein